MLKKLHILLIFNNLVVSNQLSGIIVDMRNFVTKFGKILELCKKFAGNQVNEKGNVPRRGVVPTFSDLEVVALSITAEALSITGVIHSFDMTAANVHDLQYLKDVQWEYSDCMILGDKGYLSAPVQLDLFETANIKLDVPYRLNQKNWAPPTWAYKRFRKRIETVFFQLNDHLMMIRNYAKKPSGLFARMEAKVAAFTVLQYINLLNHRPIGQVKYALF